MSSGINGSVSPLECTDSPAPSAFQTVAGAIAAEPDAIPIDSGNLVGVGAVGRLAIERNADGFARAVATLGMRTVSFGHNDLAAPRSTLLRAARAMRALGVPMLASNLTCDPGVELCDALHHAGEPAYAFETPHGRVAVIALVAPAWLNYVARGNAEGVHLADPLQTLQPAVRAARAAGARYVIATFDPDSGSVMADALALADSLPDDARPDLIVVNGLAPQTASHDSPNEVTIAASRSGRAVLVVPNAWHPTRAPRTGPAPAEVALFATQTNAALCRELNVPLAGGTLASPIERDEFASVLLDVLREQHRADVAVINRAAIWRAPFPIRERITRLSVIAALPYDNAVRVTVVRGSVLRDLARGTRAQWLYLRGITVAGDTVKVNGRSIDPNGRYTVVTTDYIAGRGDGGLGDDDLVFRPASDSLRETFLAWLGTPRDNAVTLATIDLARRTRWTLSWTLDAQFAAVNIDNPNPMVYSDAQLVRAQTLSFRVDSEVRADADHPNWALENSLRIRYGLTRTITPAGVDSGFTEDNDLIAGRTTWAYRGFRARNFRWYTPEPFAELYNESEFTRPSVMSPMMAGARDYHHLLVRPSAGLRFEPVERFTIFAGVGFAWEVFEPNGRPVPNLIAGWVLRSGRLFSIGTRDATGESTLDVSYRNWFGTPDAQVRFSARIALPLFEPLSLLLGYDFYMRYDTSQARAAFAGDGTVGLRVSFSRAVQAFRF